MLRRRKTAVPEGAALLRDDQLDSFYGKVQSFEARDTKWARRGRSLLLATAVAEGLVICALTYSLASITPSVRIVPTFIWVRQDGNLDAQVAMSALPADAQDAVVRATLAQYVTWREGYSLDTAKFRHDFVVALSSGTVGRQYTDWFNYPNPASPQVWLGGNGTITIEENYADFRENDPHVYEVTYTRITKRDGQPEKRERFRASVHWKRLSTIPAKERNTINPGGIQVVGYPDPVSLDAPPTTPEKKS